MMKTLALLIASTALTTAIAIPAWSAMRASTESDARPMAAIFESVQEALPLILISDDDEDENDDDEDDNDECDDDEDDDSCGAVRKPAPAGTVAPPQNGLFGSGTPPQVKVN
jgi:hypothetical protein